VSKIIASAAIRGAHAIVARAEKKLKETIEAVGKDHRAEFPNTGYYLPVIYAMTGEKVEKVADMERILERAKSLLPPVPDEKHWLPYLAPALDAGMVTLWAEEIIEACKYIIGPNPVNGIWLGAADDVIMRERGIEFVDGTAPGFAACVGSCPDNETAVKIARELQQKSLYIFMSATSNGKSMAQQLAEEGVQMGWETRLVPYGSGIEATVYALGFAARAAMSFGGVEPGDFVRNLRYNKNRVFAFVLALGPVDDEKYANAAGAINFGFPTIADTDIPQVLPTGICTYEHVVSEVPLDRIVEKAIEVRGLKITITEIPIPVPYSPAFEGERVRKEQMQVEFGGQRTAAVEFLTTRYSSEEVQDGKIELIGPDIDTVEEGGQLPLGVFVEVYGRKMQPDFEPILERQIHMFCNGAQGLFHMGQRDITWIRISKEGYKAGFRLRHIGDILYAKFHEDFGAIFDKIQITLYTNEEDVVRLGEEAAKVFAERDARLAGMTDESVDTYYSCTLCQSFAPNHVCMITPEHPGLCGAYNWLDGRAAYEINPAGPNQPVPKGKTLDEKLGQWEKVNEFVYNRSNFTLERFSAYSMMIDPMTSCGCFECASVVLPATNGIMIVPREYPEMTPCGMKFSTLAGEIGGGKQTPGFFGHSKQYISSPKFHLGDGGLARVVWMTTGLKEEIREAVTERAKALGLGEDFLDKVADETAANTEEEVLAYITEKNHPVLQMEPMF